jgi:hypothetical protein
MKMPFPKYTWNSFATPKKCMIQSSYPKFVKITEHSGAIFSYILIERKYSNSEFRICGIREEENMKEKVQVEMELKL